MKKGFFVLAALIGVLAVTSGAFAAQRYMITSSSQIKAGAVSLSDLAPGARKAMHGQKGDTGATGPQGPAGTQGSKGATGSKGDTGARGPQGTAGAPGSKGETGKDGAPGQDGKDGAPGNNGENGKDGKDGKDGKNGFSMTAFGPYASDSPDSGICGNTWTTDKMDRSYVVYPQLDGSFLVAETFTNGTFTTIAGDSPGDSSCGSTDGDVADGITGTMHGYFLVKVPAGAGDFNPEATCAGTCYTKDFVQTFFGTSSYDVPVFEMHYSAPGHGDWTNASPSRGGNVGNIS